MVNSVSSSMRDKWQGHFLSNFVELNIVTFWRSDLPVFCGDECVYTKEGSTPGWQIIISHSVLLISLIVRCDYHHHFIKFQLLFLIWDTSWKICSIFTFFIRSDIHRISDEAGVLRWQLSWKSIFQTIYFVLDLETLTHNAL